MRNILHNPQIIPRPRLLTKLQGAVKGKLTLISAPPGYGKSVLAAQFAEQSPIAVAWYTIEERDRDLTNLYLGSVTALGRIIPNIDTSPPQIPYSSSEIAALIADHLWQVQGDIVYILDDVQHIQGSPSGENWLRTLINLLPSNCHLMLIGRTLPELPLTDLIVHQEVVTIGQDDLRLNMQEIHSLADDVLGQAHQNIAFDKIDQHLEGWPAGVVLSFYPLPDEFQRALFKGQSGPQALFNALAESMLQTQPPSIRDFLLASSTLFRMSPELLEDALQLSDSRKKLTDIRARNLFVSQTSNGLVYHSLFRDFLQEQLKRADILRFLELHLKAACHFEAQNDIDQAFTHFMEAQQYSRASELAESVAEDYFIRGRAETLLRWETTLAQIGMSTPKLQYVCAIIATDRYEFALAETRLNSAEVLFANQQDELGLAKVALHRAYNEMQQAKHLQAYERLTHLLENSPAANVVRGRALLILGELQVRTGNLEKSLQYFSESLTQHRANANAHALSQLLQTMGMAYERLGRLAEASACLQETVAILRTLGAKRALALALTNLGYYFFIGSNYGQARLTYEEGLRLVTQVPDRRAESSLLWNLGDLERDLGNFTGAEKIYLKALETLRSDDTALHCYLLLSMALLNRWQRKWQEAISLAGEASVIAEKNSLALQYSVAQTILWASKGELGKPHDALLKLEHAIEDLRSQNARLKLLSAMTMYAHVAAVSSRMEVAKKYLRSVISLSEEIGTAQPVAVELLYSEPLLTLWRSLQSGEQIKRDLQSLENVRTRIVAESRHNGPQAIPTLSLRVVTFGEVTVWRDGKRISSTEWRSSTARELFLYLLFEGPKHREQIGVVFWPESSSEVVRSNFHTALKRARHALGENVLLFSENYALNPAITIWCDAIELESLLIQARALSPHDARTEDLFRRANDLCGGEFLPDLYGEWTMPHRRKYNDFQTEVRIGLAKCMQSRNDYNAALRILRRGLELEPYREDIHRMMMYCYAQKGEKRKVLDHYRQLLEVLKTELDIEPEPETKQLLTTLMS